MSGCSDLQLAQGQLRSQRATCAAGSTVSVSWASRFLFYDQELGIADRVDEYAGPIQSRRSGSVY